MLLFASMICSILSRGIPKVFAKSFVLNAPGVVKRTLASMLLKKDSILIIATTLLSLGSRIETSGSTPSLFATSGAFSSSLGFSSGVSSGLSLGPLGVTGVGLLRLPSLATFVFELSSPPENKNIAATIATSATPPTAPPMMSICLFLAPALLGPF